MLINKTMFTILPLIKSYYNKTTSFLKRKQEEPENMDDISDLNIAGYCFTPKFKNGDIVCYYKVNKEKVAELKYTKILDFVPSISGYEIMDYPIIPTHPWGKVNLKEESIFRIATESESIVLRKETIINKLEHVTYE